MKIILKQKFVKEKGITLIALVITIIVLLILAGVSIAMLTGQNGILTQAQRAKEETEKATKDEEAKLEELEQYIKGKGLIPVGLEIGSTVNYSPSGTYDWNSKYCSSPENLSYQKNLNSATGEPFNINIWKVFDINESTGEVILVPEHSTDDRGDGTVYLYGPQGYNNAVYLLNEACSELYGDSSKGITARSINIEDIERKMKDDALVTAHSYDGNEVSYGQKQETEYPQSNSYYPIIYSQERLRELNGEYSDLGLGMSEQTKMIESTDDGANDGYLQATSMRGTQTYWYGDNSFMKNAFKDAPNGINYYNLLMTDDINTNYWVASRCISTDSEVNYFSVSRIKEGTMNSNAMFISINKQYDGYYYGNYGLFPIVSLNSKLISGNATDGFSVR